MALNGAAGAKRKDAGTTDTVIATWSAGPPGVKPTTMRMGLAGKVWAPARPRPCPAST